jgi:hypothetical protein
MAAAAEFYPTGVYRRQAFKAHASGGMLIEFARRSLQIYCVYPDRMPWTASKSQGHPGWRRVPCGRVALGATIARVRRHRGKRERAALCGRPYGPHPELDACERFLALFEPAELSVLEHVDVGSWRFFVGLRHCPGLLELASGGDRSLGRAGDLALAYTLTVMRPTRSRHDTHPWRGVRRLLRLRRREIVELLGFVSYPNLSALNLLQRVASRSLRHDTVGTLHRLLQTADRPMQRLLAHTDRINAGALQLLYDARAQPGCLSPALLHEVGHDPRMDPSWSPVCSSLRDTLALGQLCQVRLPVIRSLDALQALHEELLEQSLAARLERLARRNPLLFDPEAPEYTQSASLPGPPVQERPGQIEYVSWSRAELEREGEQMRNCVGTYGDRVARGECAIYRVHEPERCTLSIGPDGAGGYVVGELRTHRNGVPTRATFQYVERWLATSPVLRPSPTGRDLDMALAAGPGYGGWEGDADPEYVPF